MIVLLFVDEAQDIEGTERFSSYAAATAAVKDFLGSDYKYVSQGAGWLVDADGSRTVECLSGHNLLDI